VLGLQAISILVLGVAAVRVCRTSQSAWVVLASAKDLELTFPGSRPATPTDHPIPPPNARLTRLFTAVVFPQLLGPMTMTRGPIACSDGPAWR
jgi:hypothetical protein